MHSLLFFNCYCYTHQKHMQLSESLKCRLSVHAVKAYCLGLDTPWWGLTDGEGWFYFSRQLLIVCSSSSRCGALWAFSSLPLQVVLLYGPCSGDHFPEMQPGCRPLSYTEDTVSQETMSWASCSYPLPTLSSSMFLRLKCSGCFVREPIWVGHPMVDRFLCFLQYGFLQSSPCPIKRHSFDEEWGVHLL